MGQSLQAPLSAGAQRLVEAANGLAAAEPGHMGTFHWLLALVQRHGAMAETVASGINAATLRDYLKKQLMDGQIGEVIDPQELVNRAVGLAQARGRADATERDLAVEILRSAGYELRSEPLSTAHSESTPVPAPSAPGEQTYVPRSIRPTPSLEEFGRDVTRAAMDGKLGPVVGRDTEIDLVIETLSRRTKRNPVLVGLAGVGKTAIIEGLAQRVVRGDVPTVLKGIRIFEVQPSSLVAGAGIVGELNQRMKVLLQEASQDGIVLFIDEVHSMVGVGGQQGTGDIASLLKPALARGDLACIAATTDDEYRRFIEPDAALERRFQPIRVQELTPEQTMVVLRAVRDDLGRLRNTTVADDVLQWLLDFATIYLRNRTFPDKAIDILEQCVAYAVTHGRETVTVDDAEAVAQRMIGMPLGVDDRIGALRGELCNRKLLPNSDIEVLLNRLGVTMRGLDLRSSRPNMVVLLSGEAADGAEDLGRAIADSLLGSESRVISIDFSRFTHPSDVTMLVGAPPGYIGYTDSLPVHRIAQMPWSVLLCQNVDLCESSVLHVLAQALNDGFITQSDGKRIYLSDTVVLLTTTAGVRAHHAIGFHTSDVSTSNSRAVGDSLPPLLVNQLDLICTERPRVAADDKHWLEETVLPEVTRRYQKYGIDVRCDPSLVTWFLGQVHSEHQAHYWERLVDEHLTAALIPYIGVNRANHQHLVIRYADGAVRVGEETNHDGGEV